MRTLASSPSPKSSGWGCLATANLPEAGAALQSMQAWSDMVLGGDRVELGMSDFSGDLTPETVELIRAYVARQATIRYMAEQGGR